MEKENKLSEEEMKVLLGKEKQERAEKCMREIEVILQKYNCQLNVTQMINIIAKE